MTEPGLRRMIGTAFGYVGWAMMFFLLAVSGCSTIETSSDYDASVDFSGYQTYRWLDEQPNLRSDAGPEARLSPLVAQRLRDAVEATLASKGFRKAEPADMAVSLSLDVRLRQFVHSWYPYGPYYDGRFRGAYVPMTTVETFTEKVIAVDLFDAGSGRAIWRGTATTFVDWRDEQSVPIDALIGGIFEDFPPQPVK